MEELQNSGEVLPTPLAWAEPFEWREPIHWEQTKDIEDLASQLLDHGPIEAGLSLLENRRKAAETYGWEVVLHTPPAAEHYRHTYLWDSGFCMVIYSRAAVYAERAAEHLRLRLHTAKDKELDAEIMPVVNYLEDLCAKFKRAGIEEGFWLMDGQREDGFIPNVQYAPDYKWYEIEKVLSLSKPKRTSNYSQPPVIPLAVLSQYKAMEQTDDPNAEIYLDEIYGRVRKFMDYFDNYRRNSDEDALIGVIEPHETGMDSLRQWDYIKPWRRRRHPGTTQREADLNTFVDGAHFVDRITKRRFIARGDIQKERKLFWANDVSFNAIYFHNLQAMVRLAETRGLHDDARLYAERAAELEQAMVNQLWREDPSEVDKPGFYSLNANGEPINTITISNLFGLVLPGIGEKQLEAVLDMMDDDFDVPYPLPSDSKNSPEYDPRNQEKNRLWRGPTWFNTNYYLVAFGLRMQAERRDISSELAGRCRAWAYRIIEKSNESLDLNLDNGFGAPEHIDPETGAGQRPRVKNFSWTWLVRLMS